MRVTWCTDPLWADAGLPRCSRASLILHTPKASSSHRCKSPPGWVRPALGCWWVLGGRKGGQSIVQRVPAFSRGRLQWGRGRSNQHGGGIRWGGQAPCSGLLGKEAFQTSPLGSLQPQPREGEVPALQEHALRGCHPGQLESLPESKVVVVPLPSCEGVALPPPPQVGFHTYPELVWHPTAGPLHPPGSTKPPLNTPAAGHCLFQAVHHLPPSSHRPPAAPIMRAAAVRRLFLSFELLLGKMV